MTVVDRGQHLHYCGGAILDFLRHLHCTAGLIGIIFIRQFAALDIAVADKVFVDGRSQLRRDLDFAAVGIGKDFTKEQLRIDLLRPVSQGFRQAGLQRLRKLAELHVGDQRQFIQFLHLAAQHALIHALALLVNAQPQAASDLLPTADVRVTLLFQRTYLEDIGIVPALPQRGVGENESHRLVETQQPLFVLRNEVVGVRVIGSLCLTVNFTLHKAGFLTLLFVDGKVALVGRSGTELVQIAEIGLVADLPLQLAYNAVVLFFKHLSVLAVAACIIVAVIAAVFGHLINEKQAQYLDALTVQFLLPLDMRADGLADLDAPLERHHLFAAADLPGVQLQTIEERNRVVPPVNAVRKDLEPVGVLVQPVGQIIKIIAAADFPYHGACTGLALYLKAQPCGGGFVLIEVDALQIYIAVGGGAALQRYTQRGDLLHQMLVVGVHGVQTIHHIVLFLMGGGIAQREQGAKLFQALLGLLALHALWLVDNKNGVGFGNDVDGLAAAEGVQLFVNNALVLAGVERLHIDDHDVDGAVRRKGIYCRKII